MYSEEVMRRFWAKVNKDGPTKLEELGPCWIWQGATVRGYGVIKVDGKHVKAHRFSYEAEVGPMPDDMQACHMCDTPLCVNYEHIFPGTNEENIQDKVAKGRQTHGPRNSLTPEEEEDVRTSYYFGEENQSQLAARYHVRPATISRILRS